MTNRTKTRTVTFRRPFLLDEIERELPAGPYLVETEEETLDGFSFRAWRRVSTLFIARGARGMEMWEIHPDGLDEALTRDLLPASGAGGPAHSGGHTRDSRFLRK